MEIGWLDSLLFGLLSGLTEILPVSSGGHQAIFLWLKGGSAAPPVFSLCTHLGILAALAVNCSQHIRRMRQELRLARTPKRRRKRPIEERPILDWKLLKNAALPLLLCFLLKPKADLLSGNLLWLSVLFIINGLILIVPSFLPSGNKDSRMMSPLDGFFLGLCGGIGVFPGISRLGSCLSAATGRGSDRRYALDIGLMLCIPAIIVLLGFDIFALVAAGAGVFGLKLVLKCLLSALSSYLGVSIGMIVMRFLAVSSGYSGFAFYSWGAALFTFILFLTT